MEIVLCNRTATIKFWDDYAKWYKLWIEHTHYHKRIIEVLKVMSRPDWKVLDISAGNGILSIPLYVQGCEVTALEPSVGMRNRLDEEVSRNKVDGLNVDKRVWEKVPCHEYSDYDLILACNSLHLTQIGFEEALEKVFRARPRNVFLIFEPSSPNTWVNDSFGEYKLLFTTSYEIDNSFVYHHSDEIVEHWTLMKGCSPQPDEIRDLKKRIIFKEGHLWIKQTSPIMMCWWTRIFRKRGEISKY